MKKLRTCLLCGKHTCMYNETCSFICPYATNLTNKKAIDYCYMTWQNPCACTHEMYQQRYYELLRRKELIESTIPGGIWQGYFVLGWMNRWIYNLNTDHIIYEILEHHWTDSYLSYLNTDDNYDFSYLYDKISKLYMRDAKYRKIYVNKYNDLYNLTCVQLQLLETMDIFIS